MVDEQFIAYIWQFGLFEQRELRCTNGKSLHIIATGERNSQSGPDFFNARVMIDDTTWAGNVELHVKASDWLRHGHQHDKSYDSVVLHVVWEADIDSQSTTGQAIPCLVLDGRVQASVYQNYQYLRYSTQKIPCAQLLPHANEFTVTMCLDRMLVERLEQKAVPIMAALAQNQYHWEETFYRLLSRALGAKANSDAMEQVAQSLPLSVLAKHKDQLVQLEALLLGQAGWLDNDQLNNDDPYVLLLQREYRHLRHKYQLRPLATHIWKFGGLRPPNFPTIRLAQLAALVYKSSHLFSKICQTEDPSALLNLFTAQASEYWDTHYTLDKTTARRSPKNIGDTTLQLIIINTVVPLIFLYGKERALPDLQERALRLLAQLPPEQNAIIAEWHAVGIKTQHAFDTQALLQLYSAYCQPKRCLSCTIGNELLRRKNP